MWKTEGQGSSLFKKFRGKFLGFPFVVFALFDVSARRLNRTVMQRIGYQIDVTRILVKGSSVGSSRRVRGDPEVEPSFLSAGAYQLLNHPDGYPPG